MQIKELTIYGASIKDQVHFYTKVLGLKLISRQLDQATFQVGNTVLKMVKNPDFTPYHFAINIPCNKEDEALVWLKQRVDILKDGDKEIQDFDFWNAKAIYFYDPDNNIVELIARKNLNNVSNEPFDEKSLIEISEIGLPVLDIGSAYDAINNLCGITVYSGGMERFCAIGDEHGLFICIDKEEKDWFPTGDQAHSSDFDVRIGVGDNEYHLRFHNGKISGR